MNKATCLILGSCLALQTVAAGAANQADRKRESEKDSRSPASLVSVPLYHGRQSRELLGRSNTFAFDSTQSDAQNSQQNFALAAFIYSRVYDLMPTAHKPKSARVAKAIIDTANRYKLDPLLLMALIKHESRFNPNALGRHGEIGLMQVKPSTAIYLIERGDVINHDIEHLEKALKDPVTNIAFGAAYLARLQKTFKGRGSLFLAAYNMGVVNLRGLLREGERPRIYADRVINQYVGLNLDFGNAGRRPAAIAGAFGPTFIQ